jgi:hypothetical protein
MPTPTPLCGLPLPVCPLCVCQVQGFMKTAMQGDRTLPGNAVVGKLKGLVTEFKATLPVVVNLRCPALRRRHWAHIHQAVGYEIKVEAPPGAWAVGRG